MNIDKRLFELKDEFVAIRKQIHEHPELGFEETKTSALVAGLLKEWGYEVHTGIGKTGVVGVMKKGNGTKRIMLRADMDALPMQEYANVEYKSKCENKMHACGHDGHTATLLLAAKYMKDMDFDGVLQLIFQPAEEMGAGAKAMIEDGLFEKFPTDFIFGYHNMPNFNTKKGLFFCKSGGLMASIDVIKVKITGVGGHGSAPQFAKDPTIAAASMLMALQTIVSRQTDPQRACVVSCGGIQSGTDTSYNIIPHECTMLLSTRALDPNVRTFILEKIQTICKDTAKVYDVSVDFEVLNGCEVTFNDAEATKVALAAASEVFGEDECVSEFDSLMGSEDFGEYAKHTKAAYCFLQNGAGHYVHHPEYIFNDDLLVYGAAYFAKLVQNHLK